MSQQPKPATALVALAAIALAATSGAAAPAYVPPPETIDLKTGAGADLVRSHCVACHSLDYITTQPKAVSPSFWDAEVTKMVGVFGAPIPQEDAARIVTYLNAAYRG